MATALLTHLEVHFHPTHGEPAFRLVYNLCESAWASAEPSRLTWSRASSHSSVSVSFDKAVASLDWTA
jgi:hypothetical protein